ncbi:hypothetical protein ERE07_13665 [Allopusillimonas ginsengisoli]|nr:hypothetical protein ERE07_13665 [Allopusillimonas ginsengisoli]
MIVVCGAGTFLIRWLPMIWHTRGAGRAAQAGVWRRALDAIGPSAIVALLTVSLWGLVDIQALVSSAAPVLLGLLGVVLGHRYLHGIAWATLAGVLAYGISVWLLATPAVSP